MDTRRTTGMMENIRLAFRGILTHKMRSFLTMLGIIIGIAAIIAIVSTIRGTNEQIKQNLIGSGTNTVTVNLNQGESIYEFGWRGLPDGVNQIRDDQLEEIMKVNHVKSVSKFVRRTYADGVFHAGVGLNGGAIYGIDLNYLNTAGFEVTKGRGFSTGDFEGFKKVILLDDVAVTTLFSSDDPIGKTIEIKGEPFTVIGTVHTISTFEPVIENINDYNLYHQQSSGAIYVPIKTWPIIYQFDEPECVLVGIDETDAMTSVGQEVASILNKSISPTDETIKYAAEDLLQQAERLQQLSQSTNMMLIWIAAISLLVGGIGVMNIMLVSVTERTKEIGLKKALGARRKSILIQFLTEASVLTSIGGFIGVLVGIGLAYVISIVAGVPVAISWLAIIVAFVFSAAVGIIFGLLPSVKASKLDPIEALRYE